MEHHFDFSEGAATVNGKAGKYIVGIWKNGNATNGALDRSALSHQEI